MTATAGAAGAGEAFRAPADGAALSLGELRVIVSLLGAESIRQSGMSEPVNQSCGSSLWSTAVRLKLFTEGRRHDAEFLLACAPGRRGPEPRNMSPVADYYMSQADIARELEVSNEAVRGWRKRYHRTSSHPFPEPDTWTGVDEIPKDAQGRVKALAAPEDPRANPRENSRSVPGWRPERLDDIKEWRKGMPGAGARTDLV